MDYLLARIDTRKKANMRLVLSDKTTYQGISLDHSREYNDEYKLQDGEWFRVDSFKDQTYFKEWVKIPFNAADYAQVQVGEYAGLKFLVSYQDGNKLMFQRIFSGSVYENNTFLTPVSSLNRSFAAGPTAVENGGSGAVSAIPAILRRCVLGIQGAAAATAAIAAA